MATRRGKAPVKLAVRTFVTLRTPAAEWRNPEGDEHPHQLAVGLARELEHESKLDAAATRAHRTVGGRAWRSPRAPCRPDQARRTAERRVAPLRAAPHAHDRLSPLQAIGRRIREWPRARPHPRTAPPCAARDRRPPQPSPSAGRISLTSVANSSRPAGVVPSRSCTMSIDSGALTSSS